MKRMMICMVTVLTLTIASSDAMSQQGRGKGKGQGMGGRNVHQRMDGRTTPGAANLSATGTSTKSASIELLNLWEEEKLARDVYTTLSKTTKLPIFSNISRAESKHMQAVERLLSTGGANRVTLNRTPGEFTLPEYRKLYQTLVDAGSQSTLDALRVGAKIEEMDIADLKKLLAVSTEPRTSQVLENLLRASHNHLRAFASQIARQGGSYDAEFLSQAEFDRIANSTGEDQAGAGPGSRGNGGQWRGGRFGSQTVVGGGGTRGAQNRGRGRGFGRQGR